MAWINIPDQLKNKKFERAIVFVHGLNGDSSTWADDSSRFVDKFKVENEVYSNFALYIFEYHTKIIELSILRKFLSIIPGKKPFAKKEKFNVGIRRIAMQLKASLRDFLNDYKIIILMAHSMGGLIVKRALVEMEEEELKKIKLFISLSVPHHGAGLASIGAPLLKNPQLIDLQGFSDFTNDLTNRFSNLKNQPKVIYQTGNQDRVVNEGSAVPAGVIADNRIDTDDTHYKVLNITDPMSHLVYQRIIRELKDILNWERQQSTSDSANAAIDFNIPENCSFIDAAKILVSTAKCTIDFKGFTDQELKILLKPQELSKTNTLQALESLQFIGKNPIPKYQVKIIDSHFEIIKKETL
jgi:Putative serine esterase (DUF676)